MAGAPSIDPGFYAPYLEAGRLKIVHGETYALLATAHAGLVTSGTATLEAALFKVPQVVMYRTSAFAYSIAKRLVKIKFISLVNLILNRNLVLEVIQKDLYGQTESELSRILNDSVHRDRILKGYEELEMLMGEEGVSAKNCRTNVGIVKRGDGMIRSIVYSRIVHDPGSACMHKPWMWDCYQELTGHKGGGLLFFG